MSQDTGQYYLSSATCNEGDCNYPMNSQDCWSYNGYSSDLKIQHWCHRVAPGKNYTSTFWNCSVTGEPGPRTGGCVRDEFNEADPDLDERLCDACLDPGAYDMSTAGGDWIDSLNKCCGDDIGEGGYRYSDSGTYSATSTSGSGGAGGYSSSENVCDDYYGTDPTDISKWIDNDCRYGANCLDGNCYATNELGPSGGYCCGGADPDGACVGVFENYLAGDLATCGDNKECECLPVISGMGGNSFDPFVVPVSVLTSDTGLKTCVAPNGFEQKFIEITGASGGTINAFFEQGTFGSGVQCSSVQICNGPTLSCREPDESGMVTFTYNPSYKLSFKKTAGETCVVTINIEL